MTTTYKYHMFYVFWKKKIRLSNDIQKFINTSKYSYISIYGGHGLIMICNTQMSLHSYNITTCNRYECIITTFNIKTWRAIYIICVIKVIYIFFNTLRTLFQKSPNDYLVIILRDFNIDMLFGWRILKLFSKLSCCLQARQ